MGGDDKSRYEKNRLHQQQAKINAAKKAAGPQAGQAAGAKTAGRIKGGDLFNRSTSPPANLGNQQQPPGQAAQKEAAKTTPEDVANRTARAAASTVETGAATVEKGAQAAEGAAAVAQGAAKGTEAAAKGAQVASKGIGAVSEATGAASKGVMSAGQALSSTGLGAIVGVPLMALGGAGSAASAGGKAAAKGGEAAAKGVEKGAKAAGEGAKKVKEGAKKVKEGAKNVKEQAGQAKDGLDQMHKENKDGKLAQARGDMEGTDAGLLNAQKSRIKDQSVGSQISNAKAGIKEHSVGSQIANTKAGIKNQSVGSQVGGMSGGIQNKQTRPDNHEEAMKRKAALYGSRLTNKLGATKLATSLGEGSRQQLGNNANTGQSQTLGRGGQNDSIRERLSGQIQAKQRQKQEAEAQKKNDSEGDSKQDQIKKDAKAGMRRGMVYLVDLLAGGLDMGTGGLSFFIDIFMYGFSLGWLNLEMFYGLHLAKGKSRYISPISWAPFKIPVDEKAYMLQIAILTADLALFTALSVITFGGVCFMHDYLKLLVTPFDFAAAALAGGDGLCFGAIISSVLTGL